jgi:hypothetical protein
MQARTQIRSLLRQGDRRTIGYVAEVVRTVLRDPELTSSLVECAFDSDAGVRMRAADALEKVSRERIDELQPYAAVLLGLFEETEQQELRWHLAVLLPRLRLDARERRRTGQVLQRCMDAKSSIVKTFALQGLADLTVQEPSLMPLVHDLLIYAERNGTPAMKARSRKLLLKLNRLAMELDSNSL